MYEGHTIGVVIPAHNEVEFIGAVIESIPDFVDRTYVIDDASTDGTWQEIRQYAVGRRERRTVSPIPDGGQARHRQVVPLRHQTNAGRGAAVKTGYRRALEDGMDAIAVLDGDGQMDPGLLRRFLDPIVEGRADYAKGNRLLSRHHRAGMSRWRLFGNALLTYLTKVASGYWRMMDPQNGYTVISARALRSIDLDRVYEDYGFLNDMLIKLNMVDARVVDIGMRARYGDEESGIRYSTFIPKLSGLLLRGFLRRLGAKYLLFDFHPLVGLYVLGGVGTIGGVAYAGWLLDGRVTGVRVVLALLVFLFSGFLVTLAMIFDRANNDRLESRIDAVIEGSEG